MLKKLSSYKTLSLRSPSPLAASTSLHQVSDLYKQEPSTKDDGYARVRGDRRPHFPPLCFTAGKNKKTSHLKPSYERVLSPRYQETDDTVTHLIMRDTQMERM